MSSQEGSAATGGSVRIRRDRSGSSPNAAFFLWFDGVRAGRVSFGREVVFPVSAGAHRIQLRWAPLWAWAKDSEVLHFLAEPGEAILFDCGSRGAGFEEIALRRTVSSLTVEPLGSGTAEARVLGTMETSRVEERLGDDVRLIDNHASPAPVTRSLNF